jgi:hypothetical protein
MSIGYRQQSAASVPQPPAGEMNTFIDSADGKLKRKMPDGNVVDVEASAAGVTSFEGRTGVVTGAAGDYTAAEVSNVPAGAITGITVQAAIDELDADKAPIAHVGAGGVSEHPAASGLEAGFMSPSDKTKLDGVASGATANSSDAFLVSRANHTGTQPAGTITGLAAVATSGSKSDVGLGNADNTSDANKPVSTAQAAADSAVQAYAVQRGNHTGTQTAATISDFSSAADARIAAQAGIASGLATLDGSGKIPASQLTVSSMEYKGTWNASTNVPLLAAGVGNTGDFYKVSTTGTKDLGNGATLFRAGESAIYDGSTWQRSGSDDSVNSVNGYTGAVVIAKADVGLANVDNTSDANKPVSTDQAAADAAVQSYSIQRSNHTGTQSVSTITGLAAVATSGAKADVGLGNVDNTSDANKPVSTAQAAADAAVQAFAIQRGNHTGTQAASTISDFSAAADARIAAQRGVANGVAALDSGGKVPSAQLPSYVDDVEEYANLAAFPVSGETGKIYIAIDTAKTYRWSGSIYVEISPSEVVSVNGQTGAVSLTTTAIPEGSNQYFTIERAQDAVADAATDSATIAWTYNDALNQLLAAVQELSLTNAHLAAGAAIALSKLATLAAPVETYRPVNAGDTVEQAINKLLYTGTLIYRNITQDVTIPTEMTWLRANTRITGAAKLRVVGTGRVRFL